MFAPAKTTATHRRRTLLLLGSLGLLALGPLTTLPAHADPPGGTAGWTKTFGDDFTGSSVDTNKWNPEWTWVWPDGSFGGWQDYTGFNGNVAGYPNTNATIDANGLSLRSARENYTDNKGNPHSYTSGVISSDGHFWQKYGYFEAEIQVASTPGLDTAFWLFARDHNLGKTGSQELDVVEVPSGSNWNGNFINTGVVNQSDSDIRQDYKGPLKAGYHTYGVDWEPDSVTWYLDGNFVRSESRFVPQQEMYVMISNELERDFGNGNWFGEPDTSVDYPLYTHAHWVRVWKKNAAASGSAPIGRRIGIKAGANGRYLSSDQTDSTYLKSAWASSIGTWELFDMVDAGGGSVALRCEQTGKYVTVDLNQTSRVLRADWATGIGDWEKFQWQDLGGGVFALKANANGLYVACDLNNASYIEARWSTSIGDWEKFTWTDQGAYGTVPSGGSTISEGFEGGDLSSWSLWSASNPGAASAQNCGTAQAHSGSWEYTAWSPNLYELTLYKTFPVANGFHTVSAWVRSSGGQAACQMEIVSGGTMNVVPISATGTWTKISNTINVTNGALNVGFYNKASAYQWLNVDDIVIN